MAVTNQVKTILLLGVLSAVRGVVSKAGCCRLYGRSLACRLGMKRG